jgi:hypothetical protein
MWGGEGSEGSEEDGDESVSRRESETVRPLDSTSASRDGGAAAREAGRA